MNLRLKTARSSLSIASSVLCVRFIAIFSTIFLARILDPSDFGTIALALVVANMSNQFSGLGMGRAVIQSNVNIGLVAFHGFIISTSLGLLLSLIVYINSNYFAAILGTTEIASILRFLSPAILLSNITIIPEAIMNKELMFGRTSIIKVISELIYIGTALTLAILGFKLWSLVYAILVKQFFYLLLVWWMCPGWSWLVPKHWEWSISKNLLSFGIPYTFNSSLAFFNKTFDNFIVGKILGVTALGYYSKAYDFARLPITSFSMMVNNVLFSSYSKIQDDIERLSKAYIESLSLISLVAVPIVMGIFATAQDLIPQLLGEKWLPMVKPLQILCFMTLIRLISQSTGPLFLSIGRPGLNTRISIFQSTVIIITIFMLIRYGISGVALAIVITYYVGFSYNMFLLHKTIPSVISKVPLAVYPSMVGSAIMVILLHLTRAPLFRLIGDNHINVVLFIQISLGILTYVFVLILTQRQLVAQVWNLIKAVITSKADVVPSEGNI